MKGTLDELQYSVELLEGSAALRDVIDKHIHDQTLVSIPKVFCSVVVLFIVPFFVPKRDVCWSSLGNEKCVFCC